MQNQTSAIDAHHWQALPLCAHASKWSLLSPRNQGPRTGNKEITRNHKPKTKSHEPRTRNEASSKNQEPGTRSPGPGTPPRTKNQEPAPANPQQAGNRKPRTGRPESLDEGMSTLRPSRLEQKVRSDANMRPKRFPKRTRAPGCTVICIYIYISTYIYIYIHCSRNINQQYEIT